jgi:hypothetical protein
MLDLNQIPDQCDTEKAASTIAALAPMLGIGGDLPDVRTLRLWRTKRLMTIDGRHFTRRNLLEVLTWRKLQQRDGLSQQAAAQRARSLDETRLLLLLQDTGNLPPPSTGPDPLITLQLLAGGIVTLYSRVGKGAIVGHTDQHVTSIENTPVTLRQAMARLGHHYFAEGREDQASSVHQLLNMGKRPLKEWAPQALATLEEYSGVVLVDPDYLDAPVPSEECETIAEAAAGARHVSDLIERRLHEQLRKAIKQLSEADAEHAYTRIREFVARHPLTSAGELGDLHHDDDVPYAAVTFLYEHVYAPVHAWDSPDGREVYQCKHCACLIAAQQGDWGKAACCLAGCREENPTAEIRHRLPLAESYIARPEILKFWVDPARDELRIYDALRKVPRLGERAMLYPHADRCDVSVGDQAGVDVKDYRDPVILAQRLNRSPLGVFLYSDAILAIAKRRWTPAYQEQLEERLTPDRRSRLKIMSVTKAISYLKDTYGGGESYAHPSR